MDIIWICHVDMKDIAWISWCVTVNNLAQNRRGRRRAQGLTHLHAAPIPVTSRGQRFGPGTLRPLAAPGRSALTRLFHSARPAARPGSRSWPSQMQVHKKQLINNWHLSSLHAITRNIQLIIIIVTLHRAAAGRQNFYNPLNQKKRTPQADNVKARRRSVPLQSTWECCAYDAFSNNLNLNDELFVTVFKFITKLFGHHNVFDA